MVSELNSCCRDDEINFSTSLFISIVIIYEHAYLEVM